VRRRRRRAGLRVIDAIAAANHHFSPQLIGEAEARLDVFPIVVDDGALLGAGEGLDLPEVSLVAILDADKERVPEVRRLAHTNHGRAARHLHGKAVLYADVMTDSMRQAIGETDRRRRIQVQYNEENHITPQSIVKPIDMTLVAIAEADYVTVPLEEEDQSEVPPEQLERVIGELEQKMREAAKKFEFEKAAQVRDRVKALKARLVSVG